MATSASSQMVDFSNVKDGGNFSKGRVPSGDYLATITKVEDAKSKDDVHMYLFTIKLKKFSAYAYPYYCKLSENQLWKLRNLLIAAGMTVPKKRLKLDPNKVVGKSIGVTMEDVEYEGKLQSEVAAVFPSAELVDGNVVDDDDDDDEYDEPETDEVEDDEEEEEETEEVKGDEYDDMDRLELRKALKKLKPEIVTNKSMSDDDIRDLIRDAIANSAPADEDDEDDEEEPAPVRKAAPKKKATKKKAAEVTDDELEELDIDDL